MHPVGAPIRSLLRLEALAVAIAGLLVWAGMDGGWGWFALLILVPDLSFIGYVWGNRVGAAFYNFAHSYGVPLLLSVGGVVFDQRTVILAGTLWLTHIGIDRALGYGLKYASGFQDTHLGRIGRKPIPQAVVRTGEHLAQMLNTNTNEGVRPTAALQGATPLAVSQQTVAR